MPNKGKRIIKIGLTGAMGCGKSSAAAAFRSMGAEVLDADKLAHAAMDTDPEVRARVIKIFGEDSYLPTGHADRKKIGAMAFSNPALLSELEAVLHPIVERMWTKRAEEISESSDFSHGIDVGGKIPDSEKRSLVVVEMPLLFEKKLEKKFDVCISVYCSRVLRIRRLVARGMPEREIERRDAFQISPAKKAELANIVLFNESSFEFLQNQVALVLSRLI